MIDLKDDKPGNDNPLVDAESGAVKKVPQSPEVAKHEQAELERHINEPSATTADREANKPNSGEISDFAPSMNDKTAGALASATKGNFLGKLNIKNLTGKQKAGGAGLFVGLVLTLIGLVSLGPLQFIHIAQLLSQFHFSKQSDLADHRFKKMIRYWRNPDKPDRTRLGYFANKSADKLTKNLEKKGLKPKYGKGGYSIGFEVDIEKMKNDPDFGKLVVAGDEKATFRNIAAEFGANESVLRDQKLLIPDSNDYFKDRKFTKFIVRTAGLEGKIFPTKARILNKRGGNKGLFHPIKKAMAKKIDDIIAARKEKLNIKESENDPLTAENKDKDGKPVDPKNAPESTAQTVVNDANLADSQLSEGITNGGSSEKGLGKFMQLMGKAGGVKAAMGVLSITGITCLLDSLAQTIQNDHVTNVLTPIMHGGLEMIAVGNQIMSGQDIDLFTLGAYFTNLYSDKYGTWDSAKSIQTNLEHKDVGTPIPAEASLNINDNPAYKLISALRSKSVFGADGAIGAICHPISQTVALVGSGIAAFFSGGASTGARAMEVAQFIAQTVGGMIASGIAMDQIEKAILNEPINILKYYGGQYGALIDAGAFLAGNETFLNSGAQLLSPEQSAELTKNQQYVLKQERKEQSIYNKYINPIKYDSVVAQLIDNQSYNPARSFSSLPTDFLNSLSNGLDNIAGAFSPQIYAQNNSTGAATFDYGLPYAGFSQAQIDSKIVDNPEENAEIAVGLLKNKVPGKEITYQELFAKCNNLTVNDDLTSTPINTEVSTKYQGSEGIDELTKDGQCGSPTDENLLRLRFAIFDTQTAEAAACQTGDSEACTDLGIANNNDAANSPDDGVIGSPDYTDNPTVIRDGNKAAEIAINYVHTDSSCGFHGGCGNACLGLVHAYWNKATGDRVSGSLSQGTAYEAYLDFKKKGLVHKDRNPPIGAVMWSKRKSGDPGAGHTYIYIGEGKIISNDIISFGKISIVPADDIEKRWNHMYLGWSDPNEY